MTVASSLKPRDEEGVVVTLPDLNTCARARAAARARFDMPGQGPRGSRPTARGKKRERRAHDPLERYARKLDRWVDKHPVAASILSFGVLASAGIVFWNVFGEHLKWVYGKYLAEACDPYVAAAWAKAAPHFAALRALAEENAGAPASFVANLFRARPLKKTIEL